MRGLPFLVLLLAGCGARDKAAIYTPPPADAEPTRGLPPSGLAKSAWLEGLERSAPLGDQTPSRPLQEAKNVLVAVQAEMAETPAPQRIDSLRMAYLEEEVARLDALLEARQATTPEAREEAAQNRRAAEGTIQEIRREIEAKGGVLPAIAGDRPR